MFVVLVFCVFAIAATSGDEKGPKTEEIERLTSNISNSIAHDIAEAKTNETKGVNQATKQAVERVKAQLLELGKLMGKPSDVANAVAKKLVQNEEMKEVDNAIATRSGRKLVNLAKSFMRKAVRRI